MTLDEINGLSLGQVIDYMKNCIKAHKDTCEVQQVITRGILLVLEDIKQRQERDRKATNPF